MTKQKKTGVIAIVLVVIVLIIAAAIIAVVWKYHRQHVDSIMSSLKEKNVTVATLQETLKMGSGDKKSNGDSSNGLQIKHLTTMKPQTQLQTQPDEFETGHGFVLQLGSHGIVRMRGKSEHVGAPFERPDTGNREIDLILFPGTPESCRCSTCLFVCEPVGLTDLERDVYYILSADRTLVIRQGPQQHLVMVPYEEKTLNGMSGMLRVRYDSKSNTFTEVSSSSPSTAPSGTLAVSHEGHVVVELDPPETRTLHIVMTNALGTCIDSSSNTKPLPRTVDKSIPPSKPPKHAMHKLQLAIDEKDKQHTAKLRDAEIRQRAEARLTNTTKPAAKPFSVDNPMAESSAVDLERELYKADDYLLPEADDPKYASAKNNILHLLSPYQLMKIKSV